MTVIIQPSYGNEAARAHWRSTLDQRVRFTSDPHASALNRIELEQLLSLHPTGEARFWGATQAQDAKMAEVDRGDVVLFTGMNHVRAVGEVGYLFRNADFADKMWSPDPLKGSWRNVYSLLSFKPVLIPYQELRDALGSDPRDNFQGLRLVRDERAVLVLDALGVETYTTDAVETDKAARTAAMLARDLGAEELIPPERAHTEGSSYQRTERVVTVRRAEALLVKAYIESLPPPRDVQRIRCAGGITDLYVTNGEGQAELVEAKSSAAHTHVRQALGQILDYAHHISRPITTTSALFPERPSTSDVALLHAYGIDCVYRTAPLHFDREGAPAGRSAFWQQPSA